MSFIHKSIGEGGDNAGVKAHGAGTRLVRAGFIPLLDSAVLIAAAELGLAEREGIQLDLIRDVSWANIRDRLAFRQFDVAHMLAPMPVASMLSIGTNPSPVLAPFSLGRGGNAITLSVKLYRQMQAAANLAGTEDALTNAVALRRIIESRRSSNEPPLVLGMTYPYSSHNYELRYWLAAGGIDPDRDVKLVVVPPPMTSDALAAGEIDGFCVGAPWNMIAVERGVGRIVAVKGDIWPSSPEKIIGVRPEWASANTDTLSRLVVVLDRAAEWCHLQSNRRELAEMLSVPRYVDTPADLLHRVLLGQFTIDPIGTERMVPEYFSFHGGDANCPRTELAQWIYSQMVRWGQVAHSPENLERAAAAFRPDIYRTALGLPANAGPAAAQVADRFIDGVTFDPSDIPAYLRSFSLPINK